MKEFIKKKTGYEITWLDEHIQEGVFGNTYYYAKNFSFSGGMKGTSKTGNIIVRAKPMGRFNVARFQTEPSSEILTDPFANFSHGMEKMPVPSGEVNPMLLKGWKNPPSPSTMIKLEQQMKAREDELDKKLKE